MADNSVATLVNREGIGQALAKARAEYAGDKHWLNAVNRAVLNLEACKWQFDGETLIVGSASDESHYTVTADSCECKAFLGGRACWHRAARRLLIAAADIAALPVPAERCPMCGKSLTGRPYTINGKAYVYFEVCIGDGVHTASGVEDGGDLL